MKIIKNLRLKLKPDMRILKEHLLPKTLTKKTTMFLKKSMSQTKMILEKESLLLKILLLKVGPLQKEKKKVFQ